MLSDDVMAEVVRLRKNLGLSASGLADRCGSISAAVIMNLESGRPDADGQRRRQVTVDELVVLAAALGVRPYDLMPALGPEPSTVDPDIPAQLQQDPQTTTMRLTHASFAIASVLMSEPDIEWYGMDIRKRASVRSGVMYPILGKMHAAGWLTDRWEEIDARTAGRPPRRYYLITPAGRDALSTMLERASRDRRFSQTAALR